MALIDYVDYATMDAVLIFRDCKNRMKEHTVDDGSSDMEHPVCGCDILQRAQEHLFDKMLGRL